MEKKTTQTPTCSGVQDIPLETRSRHLPPDVYGLPGRSSIVAKPGSQKEQANSPAVQVLRSNALEHLSSHERDILESQLSMPPIETSYIMLYRYATKIDILILVISAICAIASGAIMPLMTVVFGQLGGTFQQFFLDSITDSQFNYLLNQLSLYFVYLGIGEFITVYTAMVGFTYTGEHVTQELREQYLAAILRQNIAIFDNLGAGEITATITANMDLVQSGVSEKVALALSAFATFVTALIVGFVKNWRLSFVLLSVVFAVVLVMGGFSIVIVMYNKRSLDAYNVGGTVIEEAITSIRTATASNGQAQLAKRYEESLSKSMHSGFKMKTAVGCMIASMMLVVYMNYGLSFWQGSRLLVAGQSTVSETLTVLMALMMGAVSIAHVAPHAQAFTAAVAAAGNIFKIIDRPLPNNLGPESLIPEEVRGDLELRNVKHIYPSRPEVTVLQDVNLLFPAGKITALVGVSGSGKSTIVGLVERFYTPVGGQVFLDGHDIQKLNLKWLRGQMSLVSQEPVLFNCSIRSNIEHGLIGTEFEEAGNEKKAELVVQAAKIASAHDFISRLPRGYETAAGDHGVLLSGGQKQRIAIARAVISNPKILLLDEATSALDSKSEAIVQAALDVAAQGRTTIVIAHRLSTIKGADKIVVLSRGRVAEQGTHEELLLRKGTYYDLIEAQNLIADEEMTKPRETDGENTSPHAQEVTNDELDGNLTQNGITQQPPKSISTLSMTLKNNQREDLHDSVWTIIKIILAFNKQETSIMIFGLLCSIIAGGAMPVQGILYAKCIVSLSLPPTQYPQLRTNIDFWSLMYLIIAMSVFFVFSAHGIAFAYCSERLIYRARNLTFRSILRQDISYFDLDINSAGALASSLSKGANDLAGISGSSLGAVLNLVTTTVVAITISCIIGWKLGLVCSATIPVLLLCGFARFWVLARFQSRAGKAYQDSAALACEAVSAVATIASLGKEQKICEDYHAMMKAQITKSLQSILQTSLLYAASQSFGLLCMALGFWYGGTLIVAREYSMFQFFVCFASVIFSAQSAGALFSFAPDMAKSRQAAQQLKKIWYREPEIDWWSDAGEKVEHLRGSVEFRDVYFSYPTRTEQLVLQGLSLKVEPGQFIALVGPSGCGKSTALGLIERFYSPTSGDIFVDGKSISSLNIREYRNHLAIVMQEPALFSGTIRENILLGISDEHIEENAVIEACKKANIHDFIMSLPNGMNTLVGIKGSLLSGGQKQRVAIARALIRNPKVLLLDEATSALDSESEKLVQDALDEASKDRTTIAVAHRLSTIQRANQIYVFDQGKIVEKGTHRTLMAMKGRYAEMARLQKLEA